jgi:hypothetical protein
VRPRRSWENDIEIDIIGISCENVNWIQMAQDHV